MEPITFGIVGAGWRTEFFLRVASACPERFRVTGVVARRAERGDELESQFGIKTFRTVDDLLRAETPRFVVSSVPWSVNPEMVRDLVGRGIPVLSETPPAPTVEEMTALYKDVSAAGGYVQVAEQYHLQPHHAARIAFARSGKMGAISQAQVAVCHGYHGVSLIRRLLGIGHENATIRAVRFQEPIVASPSRDGATDDNSVKTSQQQIATLQFGERLGVFDFTGDQYFSYIRGQRVMARGERGEIIDHQATYLTDPLTPIRVPFTRHDAGLNGNLEGSYHKGIQVGDEWFYRNPLAPGRLSDDEIAVGTCLLKMDEGIRDGSEFYPLAEACQDHYLSIMIGKAASSGETVQTETQAWAG